MSLAPFLVVLLMELADSPGWLSALFVLSTVSGQDHRSQNIEVKSLAFGIAICYS
jgi:hypothetical protein